VHAVPVYLLAFDGIELCCWGKSRQGARKLPMNFNSCSTTLDRVVLMEMQVQVITTSHVDCVMFDILTDCDSVLLVLGILSYIVSIRVFLV